MFYTKKVSLFNIVRRRYGVQEKKNVLNLPINKKWFTVNAPIKRLNLIAQKPETFILTNILKMSIKGKPN